jgi:hypothetical protein
LLVVARSLNEIFFIFFHLDFAKIYGPQEILQSYTSTVVAHGRSRQQWARRSYRRGPGVRSLTPWAMTVGAYRQAATWPPGNALGHGGMYGPIAVRCSGKFFLNSIFEALIKRRTINP